MPRAIWKGSITFGLITVPVKIYTAVGREQKNKIDLHLLHEKDGERIHYQRTCEKGHKDIDWDEIVKGYEYEKNKWVEISDDELDAIDLDTLRTIDVQTFSPFEQIDPMYFDKTYYVVPDEAGIKAYRLIADALEAEGLVGVCKVAIRERERLSALRLKDNMLVLETMHWPEEIRKADFEELKKRPQVTDKERKMARQLVKQLADDFDPSEFKDQYHRELKKIVNKKIKGEEIVVRERTDEPAEVVDLMEALRASVEAAKRGERPKPLKAAPKSRKKDSKRADEELEKLTKRELDEKAKKLSIAGRSKMDKDELIRAIAKSA